MRWYGGGGADEFSEEFHLGGEKDAGAGPVVEEVDVFVELEEWAGVEALV